MSDAKLREGVNIVRIWHGGCFLYILEETMDVLKYMEQKLFDRKVMDTISREYMTVCSRHSRTAILPIIGFSAHFFLSRQ